MKVSELVRAMMPDGSMPEGGAKPLRNWRRCPEWPPDVFAVAATIVDRSSSYAGLSAELAAIVDEEAQKRFAHIAGCWRDDKWKNSASYVQEKKALQERWARLVSAKSSLKDGRWDLSEDHWIRAAIELMIISDSACVGIGFGFNKATKPNWIQRTYLGQTFERTSVGTSSLAEQDNPYTACENVSDTIACVQPKTRTPKVGCTLRSMTHHLSLLPPSGVVRAQWNPVRTDHDLSHVFNLLVVPYPYHIPGRAFKPSILPGAEGRNNMFGVEQSWLDTEAKTNLPTFIVALIREAQRDIEHIDGVILPELAVDADTYSQIAKAMCQATDIKAQFLISGVLGRSATSGSTVEGEFTNAAVTSVFKDHGQSLAMTSLQKKHHRWRMDQAQITQYSLGDALNPQNDWWEFAKIRDRDMSFYTFRQGACFTTLVCEDLARADPGQQVIRAIGPNVVIALLMDGPQLAARWPGRYAMSLADDPGSSVLSVTSLGLIQRSNHHFNGRASEVALWRDSGGTTRCLQLPPGEHGLVLSLTQSKQEEFTLDGRSDGEKAYHWLLSGCVPVRTTQHTEGIAVGSR